MTNKINAKFILEPRAAGLSRNMIAATRHMSKRSASDVFHIAGAGHITFDIYVRYAEGEPFRASL